MLTGFKYIGEQIGLLEKKGEADRFLLGFEESYGYLLGTQVRDKDAVVAALAIAGMANEYKKQGKTLVVRLNELYAEYGRTRISSSPTSSRARRAAERSESSCRNCATALPRRSAVRKW